MINNVWLDDKWMVQLGMIGQNSHVIAIIDY